MDVARKARLALILRTRTRAPKPTKPAKFDGDNDGFRTGPGGKDNIPYTPAAKKAAAKAAAKSAPTKAPTKPAAARKNPQERAREAMAHAHDANDRIQQWLSSDRSSDPLAGMTQPQLKAAADALGLSIEGRATAGRLKAALLRHLANTDMPRHRRQPTTINAPWLPSPRPLADLSPEQAARAAREGRISRKAAAAHIRAQADQAEQAANLLRRPDADTPDERTPRQESITPSHRDRLDIAQRREREAEQLRDLADQLDPPTANPAPTRVRTPTGARGIEGYRQRLREMDNAGLEASLQVLDSGTIQFANPADQAAARRAVLAEMRRRDRAAQRATDQARRYEQIRAEQPDLDELTAWALATGQDPDQLARKMERLARPSVQQMRRDWELAVEAEFLQAEEATRGHMVKPEGRLRIDPRDFWRRPASFVARWASEDFQRWAAERGGILTFAAYRAMVEGGSTLRDIRARDTGRYGEAA